MCAACSELPPYISTMIKALMVLCCIDKIEILQGIIITTLYVFYRDIMPHCQLNLNTLTLFSLGNDLTCLPVLLYCPKYRVLLTLRTRNVNAKL